MTTPSKLYKYQPFSLQSIENLKNQVIYFGTAASFNDPFDCALVPSITEPSDEQVERVRLYYVDKATDEKMRDQFRRISTIELRATIMASGEALIHDQLRKVSSRGVSCFSENPDNLLMWSHYGGYHKGFCLEFQTDDEPFLKTRQIRYATHMPSIDIESLICNRDFDHFLLGLFWTKSSDWQYEREWRVIHHQSSTAYTYPTSALTGVYLGSEATFTSFEILALILAGQNEHVQLWKGKRSESRFSIEFEPVSYTSHLEAKRRGLL